MKPLPSLCLISSLCVFILGSCTPTSPTVLPSNFILTEDAYYASDEYTIDQRQTACEPIVPFNEGEAFSGYPRDEPILWTFGVNFDLLSSAADPLGCLHLYLRDGGTFVPIDDGGILVDTCRIEPSGSVVLTGGRAIFDGTGHIQCQLNLAEWVERLSPPINSAYRVEPTVLKSFFSLPETGPRQTHAYQQFTMVVSTTLPYSYTSSGQDLAPMMYYSPSSEGESINFSLAVWNNKRVTAPISQCDEPLDPFHCQVSFPLEIPRFWWYAYEEQAGTPQPYYWQYMSASTLGEAALSSPQVPRGSPLKFGIRQATLYIGSDNAGSMFRGSIDGILIDPSDSRPVRQ